MEYSKFKVEEFVTDEYFVRWIKKPDAETNAFWNSWLSANVQRRARIRLAREIILYLDFKINRPPEGRFLEMWQNIVDDQSVRWPGIFSPESKYDTKKMDIGNSYRFRNWKSSSRNKMLQLF